MTNSVTTSASINLEKFPEEPKQHPNWVMWRLEKTENGKSTKRPYQTNGQLASVSDPATHTSFENCIKAFEIGQFNGVGYVFRAGTGIVGIDLDNCLDNNRKVKPWAVEIVQRLFKKTYGECSPSGTGIHFLVRGTPIATGSKKFSSLKQPDDLKDPGIEIYSSGRYFTVTGQAGKVLEITDCQDELDWLYDQYFAESHQEPKQARNVQGGLDIELVRTALNCIPSDDYDLWIKSGMGLKAGGLDFELWDEWSRKSSKYNSNEMQRRWNGFKPNNIGLGTIFHHAQQFGFRFPSIDSPKKTTEITSTAIVVSPQDIDWANPDSFGEMLPFDELEGRPISTDFLPDWVKNYVDAAAAHTQAEPGAAAVLALAIIAACVQMRFEVLCPTGHKEILSHWTFLALPPASRKSALLQALMAPVIEWEQEEAQRLRPDIEKEQTEIAIIKEQINVLTRLAGKAEE
jgi:hypothetical protein